MFYVLWTSVQGHVVVSLVLDLGKTPEVQAREGIVYSNPSNSTVTISPSAVILHVTCYTQDFFSFNSNASVGFVEEKIIVTICESASL